MDEDTLLAVRVEEDKDGYLRVKSPDKAAAREQLMKHLGMFERDNTQKPLYVPPVIKVILVDPQPRQVVELPRVPAIGVIEKEVK